MTLGATSVMKEQLATALRIMVNEGLIENSGHISARIPRTNHLCVLGHIHEKGRILREATANDFIIVNLDGEVVEGKHEAPGEIYLHTEIYKVREDINSVLHTHALITVALSIAGIPVTAVYGPSGGAIFGIGTPIFESSVQVNTPDRGRKLAQVLGHHMAVMLKGHGAVTVGASIEQACIISLNLERSAKLMAVAGTFGKVQPISAEDLAEYSGRVRDDSEEARKVFWAYFGGRLPKITKTKSTVKH